MTALEIPTPDPRSFDDASRPFAEAIAGHYAIKKMIGRGGMGVVYLARDRRLERLVAIKTLPPHLAEDTALRERFLRETRTAGAMSHPNIVPIHGADEIDGHVFFVMGFVDGESLAAHVRARGRLEPRTVANYLRDVAAGLAHAHRRGIVHRDIKAENILIERATGRALVTDFGIARLAEATPLTATGQLLGTVYYVSPEQVSGEPIDARSDLYSLGVVGFLALTGQFPFDGELASAVLVAHVTKSAPPVAAINPAVPPALASIVDRCLSKRPPDRFANADELLAALESAMPELDHPAAPRQQLISDTKARAVWARAAELQALTGAQQQMPIDQLRSVASEAGIGEKYVERALAEQARPPQRVGTRLERKSFWAGVPLDVETELVVNGELAPRDFERVVNTLRDVTGKLGTTIAKSRELAWRTDDIQVSVVPDASRTTIRLSRGFRAMATASFVASLTTAGFAAGLTAVALQALMELPAPPWGFRISHDTIDIISIAGGVVVALASIPAWRILVRRLRDARAARLDALADAIAAKVRESVAEDERRAKLTGAPRNAP